MFRFPIAKSRPASLKTKSRRSDKRLSVESLETRQMMSATPLSFQVVNDATANVAYKYTEDGAASGSSVLTAANASPRGVASTVGVEKTWVIDAKRNVYTYDGSGVLLGSWSAGSMPSNAAPEGIATNGKDVWIADGRSDKVYRYADAANRLSGSQSAASSFSLATGAGNTNPKDIVSDGASLWVVDDGSKTDRVFRYSMTGGYVGSWSIDSGNKTPTGIALDPANIGDLWIADSGTDRIYKYAAATARNSGGQAAASNFALASGNTNPQGIAIAGRLWAETPYEVEWVQQFGSSGFDGGRVLDTDSAGNIYISGRTDGSLSVDNPDGQSTAFLAKFDADGNRNWLEQPAPIAGVSYEGVGVAADSLGNVFQVYGADSNASLNKFDAATGTLQWTTDLPSGEGIYRVATDDHGYAYMSSYAGTSVFLRKFDGQTGDVVWMQTLDTGNATNSSGVSTDHLGNVYVSGYTYGSAIGPNAGFADGFIAKYSEAGDLLWTRQYGTAGYDFAYGVAADALGNVYTSGGVYASVDALNASNQDMFVTKHDSLGNFQWTRQLGTTATEADGKVWADNLGGVYFTTATRGALGGPNLGEGDIVVGKYGPTGDLLWIKQIGTSAGEGADITGDSNGNIYLGGRTTASWGGPNAGDRDAVLIKLSPAVAAAADDATSLAALEVTAPGDGYELADYSASAEAVLVPLLSGTGDAQNGESAGRKANAARLLARQEAFAFAGDVRRSIARASEHRRSEPELPAVPVAVHQHDKELAGLETLDAAFALPW